MKKLLILAALAATLPTYALPTYEPFTEYAAAVSASGTNSIDLATGGFSVTTGAAVENWTALYFNGYGSNGTKATAVGLDIQVTNYPSSPFTAATMATLLPTGFPGASSNISLVAFLPQNTANTNNSIGNTAVLNFTQPVTRPTSGLKTVFVSYLLDVANLGSTGTGNNGRYCGFLASSNLVEGTNTAGFYKSWPTLFNTFSASSGPSYFSYGVKSGFPGPGDYLLPSDSSGGNNGSGTNAGVGDAFGSAVFVVSEIVLTPGGAVRDTNIVWVNPATSSFGGTILPATNQAVYTANAFMTNMGDLGGFFLEDRWGAGAAGGTGSNFVGNLLIGTTWSYVTGGPEFTNQPIAAVATNYGSTVSFTASAIAAGQSVSYQWQKVNGGTTNVVTAGAGGAGGNANVTITSTASGTTLTLAGVSANDFGSFQVVATSSGTGYALTSSLGVLNADPNIITQPQGVVASIGGTANFSVTASTSYTPLTYQWRLNGVALSNGAQADGSFVVGVTTSSLTISNVQADESSIPYTVAVSNAIPSGEISSAAVITLEDPAVTSSPVSVVTNYGATVTFTAQAQTVSAHAPLKYAWYKGGTQLVNGAQAGGSTITGASGTGSGSTLTSTLTITHASYLDNGSYSLIVTNSVNGNIASTPATLFVNDPVIITQPPAIVEVAQGGNASIPVTAAGTGISYQWNGSALPGDYSGTTSSNLVLTGAQSSDAGSFTVTVTGVTNTLVSSTVNVYVETAPTGLAVTPPALTQQSGTHLALLGNIIGGSGLVHTYWAFNGTNLTDGTKADGSFVFGSATSTLILSNLQTSDTGTYTLVSSNAAGHLSASSVVTVSGRYLGLAPTNLIVIRVGEGSQPLSGATGNTLYLDQLTTSGSYVSTIQVPDSGPNGIVVAGAAIASGNEGAQEGYLTLSSNQQYLNFGGFLYNYPYTAGADVTVGGASHVRGIYALNASGVLALVYTNYGLYSGGNGFRDVYSTDGLTNFWTTGSASGGTVKYVNAGPAGAAYTITSPGNGIPALSAANSGGVAIGLAGTNLVFTDNQTLETSTVVPSPYGIDEFVGAPQASTTASTQILGGGQAHGDDFAFSPDLQTVYVADDDYSTSFSSSTFGGIQRYDLVGGTYTYQYNLSDTTGSGTNGLRGLTVYWPTNITSWGAGVEGAVLYASTSETVSNRIIQIIDNNTSSSASVVLATAGSNQFYRGIRFGPVAQPLSITSEPQSQSALAGQTVQFSAQVAGGFTYFFPNAAGTGYNQLNATPIFYQWFTNGVAISGATNQLYVITNIQSSNAASYTFVVSNGLIAVTSAPPAVLTVTPFSTGSDLVGWFKLQDGSGTNAADSSVYGDTGALVNFPTDNSEWVAGLGGFHALNFANLDASNDNVVVVPDAPQLNFTNGVAFTLAAWINSASSSQTNGTAIIAKGYGNGGEQYALDLYTNTYRFFVRSAAGTSSVIFSGVTPPTNQWQHVAVTYDGNLGVQAIYVNGSLVTSSSTAPATLLATAYPVGIGNRPSSTNGYNLAFLGEMQDVRLYNTALGASDVAQVYQTLAPATPPPRFSTNQPPAFAGTGQFLLNLTGTPNSNYRLWVTTNIALTPVVSTWTLLTNSTFNGSGTASFVDTTATNKSKYYVITQP